MTCKKLDNAIICGPDYVVNLAPYGSKVWMEWHHYIGPTFYRSMNMIKPIDTPSSKTWMAYSDWMSSGQKGIKI